MENISICYNPKEVEEKWYKFWQDNNFFSAKPNPFKKPFCIVIPPPNVTGILHMGHALNNTIQDILIRYHRMKGFETLWVPGTDHAGIATQNVVEKEIAKEGLKRQDLGRNRFLERVWQWKEKYGSTIIQQLKKLGASCDWSRNRFTMDEAYSEAVKEVFIRLYEKGLLYQGYYIINWCPRCQTALSDEEAPHKDIDGYLYYIKYPLKKENSLKSRYKLHYIVVATTRPETMLGDTAIAVHPKDRRYKDLIGKSVILPLLDREIRIIGDEMVDKKFGTGAVKVTPAHDPNDYLLAKKHKLEFINIMNPDGSLNENASSYTGLDRFTARKKIIEDLEKKGLLEKIVPYKISVGHCYRCHTIIEPYLSKQWFVKMKPLAEPAIKVVKEGKIKFHPKRWTKVYLNWMENIQDWCISRQIWWGHRLPVYYCRNCQDSEGSRILSPKFQVTNFPEKKGIIVSKEKPTKCPVCKSTDIYQDEDVLDTWFSSWLWPFATFYWPKETEDLRYFYPTSVLVTAPEIIFFWVARMIMAGLEFMGDIPFRDVYIHGTVRDIEGRKMSKSLGNIIDPLEIIERIGADALRFSLVMITATGQDVFLSEEKFKIGRNFCNKIWNASRLILMNLEKKYTTIEPSLTFKNKKLLSLTNRWILSRFYSTLKKIESALKRYSFNEYANIVYQFFWHEFCDWYLEIVKPKIKDSQNQFVMYEILEKFLRCLHPIMPFITEEIWQKLPKRDNSVMIQPWPDLQNEAIDLALEKNMESVFGIISAIRSLRKELKLDKAVKLKISLYSENRKKIEFLKLVLPDVLHLAEIEGYEILNILPISRENLGIIIEDINVFISLKGLIDIEEEKKKISKQIEMVMSEITKKELLLKNHDFLKKAPSEIVEQEREKLKQLYLRKKTLERILDGIKNN